MRLIVLGASNVTIHLPRLVQLARQRWGPPLEIVVAGGFGRSYGQTSRFLLRTLPGILQCGMWSYLQGQPEREQRALVTDVGNDLLYGATVEQTQAWVQACIERLHASCRLMTLVGVPCEGVARLPAPRFYLLSRTFYPRTRLCLADARSGAHQLDQALRGSAQRLGIQWLDPPTGWYGWDPIHIRPTAAQRALATMLGSLQDTSDGRNRSEVPPEPLPSSAAQTIRLRRLTAQQRRIAGWQRTTPQPGLILHDGTRVCLF